MHKRARSRWRERAGDVPLHAVRGGAQVTLSLLLSVGMLGFKVNTVNAIVRTIMRR